MVAAILLCGLGYAEGAALSRRLGGWQVISWALLLALPMMAADRAAHPADSLERHRRARLARLAYVSIFSMLVGFIFWYRGLALGGIAGVGQLQLLQPFFGLILAALLLHEPVAWTMIVSTLVVSLRRRRQALCLTPAASTQSPIRRKWGERCRRPGLL